MPKSIVFILVMILGVYNLKAQSSITWTVAEKAKVFTESQMNEKTFFTELPKGTKVTPLARRGAGTFQVQLSDGQTGWMDYRSFSETRKLIVPRNINRFKKPDNYDSDLKGYTPEDTLFYQASNSKGNYIQVISQKKVSGWIINLTAFPLAYLSVPLRETTTTLLSNNYLQTHFTGKSVQEITAIFGDPESAVRKDNSLILTYPHINVALDGYHYHGVAFLTRNNLLETIALTDKKEKMWIESLPMAGWVRSINVTALFIRPVSKKLVAIENPEEKNSFLSIVILLLKFAVVILFFSIPILLARVSLFPLLKVKLLPNQLLKILNYVVFFFIFYLFYLLIILNVGYVSPIFFSLITFGVLYFSYKKIKISEFNHKNIDTNRCNNCRELKHIRFLRAEFIKKEHKTEHQYWRTFTGRTTAYAHVKGVDVTIHTDHYQSHGSIISTTIFTYHDHYQCSHCQHTFYLIRRDKKYGHL